MPVNTDGLTIPEAIRKLFGIDVAKESPLLKNKAMSFVRNKLIAVRKERKVQREAIYLEAGQGVALHNALVLNAVFSDPKDVKNIFEDHHYRSRCSETVRQVLGSRESLLGQAFQSSSAERLASFLADSGRDLRQEPVPNPFPVLPQVALSENTTLLHTLLAQAASLEPADSFLLAYLNGDWETAQRLSNEITPGSPELLALKSEIDRKFAEAHEFSDLLSFFRKK